MIGSHSLIFSDFETDWYKHWAKELKQNKANIEAYQLKANKFWQNAVMAQALYERGVLEKGKTCIGFGVGRERLPALFAKAGVKVTATDQDFTTEKAKHWQKHELATGTQSLNKLSICEPRKFSENVTYKSLDMTKIPKSLVGKYDFLWSNCALGHLGSIDAGINFIIESAKCLKTGGYAVHTTEVNVISNTHTVDNNPETVIFRPRDIRRLSSKLRAKGYELSPLQLQFGHTPDDHKISISPQFGNDYSKLQVGGYIITQVVLVIHKPAKINPIRKHALAQKAQFTYRKNLLEQKRFAKNNKLIQAIREYEKVSLSQDSIQSVKKTYSLMLKGKPQAIHLEYKNTTGYPIFGMHDRLCTTQPIALATSGPEDRMSKFKADDWFNGQANRPSIQLCLKDPKLGWVKADYIRPGSAFGYKLTLNPKKVAKGNYVEKFMIVQEGKSYITSSEASVKIKVA